MSVGPPKAAMLVTGYSLIPHGTMPVKWDRSGSTLIAKPCSVTHRRTRIPSAPIFASLDTIGKVKRKEQYEAQLAQIEKDIEKLSKRHVYLTDE